MFAEPGYWSDPGDLHAVWTAGDYHLQSEAGRWDPDSLSWVEDQRSSPSIDGGDPASAIGDEPIPNGEIINQGAYGGTVEASKTSLSWP